MMLVSTGTTFHCHRTKLKALATEKWFGLGLGRVVEKGNLPGIFLHRYQPVFVEERFSNQGLLHLLEILRSKGTNDCPLWFGHLKLFKGKGSRLWVVLSVGSCASRFQKYYCLWQIRIIEIATLVVVFFPTDLTQNWLDNERTTVVSILCSHAKFPFTMSGTALSILYNGTKLMSSLQFT